MALQTTSVEGSGGSSFVMASAFILKTFSLVEDPETDSYIRWTDSGDAFLVTNVEEFREVLSKHFSHSNFCSFVRQLNFYGFHKLASKDNTICFGGQPLFQRSKPHLLANIKRRISSKTKRSPASKKERDDGDGEPVQESDPIDDNDRGGGAELERELVIKKTQTGQEQPPPSIDFSQLLAAKGFQLDDGADSAFEGKIKDHASGLQPEDAVMHQLILSLRELQTDMHSVRQELAETRKENQRLRDELQELKRARYKTYEPPPLSTQPIGVPQLAIEQLAYPGQSLPPDVVVVADATRPPAIFDFDSPTLFDQDASTPDPSWLGLLGDEAAHFAAVATQDDGALNEFLDSFQKSQLS